MSTTPSSIARGAWNLSDTSNFIRKGKIERERPPHAEISPPDQLADTANRTYEYCLAVLTDSFTLATSAKPVEIGSMASEV